MASRVPEKAADVGRISLLDPLVVRTWCDELKCTEHELRAAVYAVGSEPEQIRRYFDRGSQTPEMIAG